MMPCVLLSNIVEKEKTSQNKDTTSKGKVKVTDK